VIIESGVCQDQRRQINDLPGGRGFGEGQVDSPDLGPDAVEALRKLNEHHSEA
jgi:hypothetical protein